jgi:rubrerythrin
MIHETDSKERPAPGVLCWNCRRLTPYEDDRCRHCDAAFGGSTGGEYATSRLRDPRSPPRPPRTELSRSLADLLRDLGRVHDVSALLREGPPEGPDEALFQCPSCGRIVAEDARSCACGVRFTASEATFPCPECDSRVPALDDACPVCGTRFEDVPHVSYSCPRCGAPVAADALRCACGVWFED